MRLLVIVLVVLLMCGCVETKSEKYVVIIDNTNPEITLCGCANLELNESGWCVEKQNY